MFARGLPFLVLGCQNAQVKKKYWERLAICETPTLTFQTPAFFEQQKSKSERPFY